MSSSCLNSLISHTRLAGRWGCQRATEEKGGCTTHDVVQPASRMKWDQLQTVWLKGFFQTAKMPCSKTTAKMLCFSLSVAVSLFQWHCQPFIWSKALHITGVPPYPFHILYVISVGLACPRKQEMSFSPSFAKFFQIKNKTLQCWNYGRLKI